MRVSATKGVILRISRTGESNLIVWLLTPYYGPMRVLARRGLKSVKRFGGRILLFNNLHFDYSRRRVDEIAFMDNASMIETFPGVYTDEVNFGRASLFAEVILAAWGEKDPAHNVYTFLLDYLRRSEAGKITADRHILDAFRLLEMLGYRPMFDCCTCCGDELNDSKMYSVNEGGSVCVDCARIENSKHTDLGGTKPLQVSIAVRRTIEKVYSTEPKRLDRIKFSAKARKEAEALWIKHIQAIIGRTPKSKRYLEKLGRE